MSHLRYLGGKILGLVVLISLCMLILITGDQSLVGQSAFARAVTTPIPYASPGTSATGPAPDATKDAQTTEPGEPSGFQVPAPGDITNSKPLLRQRQTQHLHQ